MIQAVNVPGVCQLASGAVGGVSIVCKSPMPPQIGQIVPVTLQPPFYW